MTDISSVLLGLNKALIANSEVALPGNWSSKLFYRDLMNHHVKSEEVFISEFGQVMKRITRDEENSYLEFFEKTRGYKRENSERAEKIFQIFSKSNLMLYFEDVFLELVIDEREGDEGRETLLIQFLNVLAEIPLSKWNEIVVNAGACCYQWFAKEPFLYMNLLTRKDKSSFDLYTDQELFQFLEQTLLNFPEEGKLSIEESRSDAIQLCKRKRG